MPRLNAMQRKLAGMAVLTDEDQAKLAAMQTPPEAEPPITGRDRGGDSSGRSVATGTLPKTSTREELEKMKKAMAQQMRKQRALEEQLAQKQDLEDDPDHETSVDMGGGSMQVHASAGAAKRADSGQQGGADALTKEVAQLTEQLADIRMSVVQHSEQIQHLREHTGMQLTLPQAVAKIRSILELEVGMRTKDVVAYAKDELGLLCTDDASTKTKVWHLCEQLNVQTGWPAPTAAPAPELSYEEEMARDELLYGGGGAVEGDEDASIC
jgi:hypothetical protein